MSIEEERRCERIGEKNGYTLLWQVSGRSRIEVQLSSTIWSRNKMFRPLSNSTTCGPFLPQNFWRCGNISPESICICTCSHTAMFQDSVQNVFPHHYPCPLSSLCGSLLFLFIAQYCLNSYQGVFLLFICILFLYELYEKKTILFFFFWSGVRVLLSV